MARAPRPLFRRRDRNGNPITYIAVKPIMRGSASVIPPGEEVNLRPHQLRSLYQRRRIGPKGHPWTEQALQSKGFPKPFVSDTPPAKPETFEDQFPITTETGATIDAEVFADFVANRSGDLNALAEMDDAAKQEMLGELVAEMDAPAAQALAAAQNSGGPDEPAAEAAPVEPVKIKSQWELPGLTDQKFKTKKAAKEWLAAQGGE